MSPQSIDVKSDTTNEVSNMRIGAGVKITAGCWQKPTENIGQLAKTK